MINSMVCHVTGLIKKSCNNITLVSDHDLIPATRNRRAVVKLALIHSGESGHVMW